MNEIASVVRREVEDFVAAVRSRLADLDEEEREELLGGLEADVSELVADRGSDALGDPVAYADELRAAAGLEPPPRRVLGTIRGRAALVSLPDDLRHWWETQVARPRVAPAWKVVAALRPAWWALRAWVAAVLLARLVPGWYDYGLAWLPGVPVVVAVPLLAVCVVGSVLVGLGQVWPGSGTPGGRGIVARGVLLVLNAGAVAGLFVANGLLEDVRWDAYTKAYAESQRYSREVGLQHRGREVCNIQAYDAAGEPLLGVQLFDQAGRPLEAGCFDRDARRVSWVLGDVPRWNVFPLGVRERPAWEESRRSDLGDAAFPVPDRATIPAVTHPLLPPAEEPLEEPAPEGGAGRKAGSEDRERERGTEKRPRR